MLSIKNITESQDRCKFSQHPHAICNLHFALVLHKNELVYSQSDTHSFFMHIIIIVKIYNFKNVKTSDYMT